MPVRTTYPGVYIQEVSSGVHTITGVATSIAAFVGFATKGRTDKATHIYSWSDFENNCGPIDARSYLGYAVKQFFDNGGSEAYIVRLVPTDATPGAASAGGINISASSQGQWSAFYGVTVKTRLAQQNTTRFTISVVKFPDDGTGKPDTSVSNPAVVESFENLSLEPTDIRFAPEIINDENRGSSYIHIDPANPGSGASDTTAPVQIQNGTDGNVGSAADPDATVQQPWFLTDLDNATLDGTGLDANGNPQPGGALYQIDLFNLLCIPGLTDTTTLSKLLTFCQTRRAFLIADCPRYATFAQMQTGPGLSGGDLTTYAAIYFPWLIAPDPLSQNRLSDFPPCGFVAGVYARTDTSRGVWKAPAGIDAGVVGATSLKVVLNDPQNGQLNIKAVNCFRTFPVYNTVLWGARTMRGDDEIGSEWKYIPVRRMALFIEESLYRGTKWVVFEPNDEPLWSQIRLNVGAFMQGLFRQGAFQGQSPKDAYLVKCDKETTTQNDINRGIVNIIVGFAPLKPAEFVIITIQQLAGNIQT